MVDETEFDVMDNEELESFHKPNEFWTQEELDILYDGARQIAADLNLDDEFIETVVRRAMDAREFPEKMLTIDEFVERCEEKGIYCSHCGNADSDCQWCVGTGDDYSDLVPPDDGVVCKSCKVDTDIFEEGMCRECFADAQAYQMLEDRG